MLKTRALARRDLIDLFGNPGHSVVEERKFAAAGTDMWFEPATRELLKKMFTKK